MMAQEHLAEVQRQIEALMVVKTLRLQLHLYFFNNDFLELHTQPIEDALLPEVNELNENQEQETPY